MKNKKKLLKQKFTEPVSLLFVNDDCAVAEIKPYLQPFEEILAKDELRGILGNEVEIDFQLPYALFKKDDVSILEQNLAYWQRVGTSALVPTDQVLKEFSQNGPEELDIKSSLHKARRLRYGVHNLHEYRGKFFPQLVKSLINKSNLEPNAIVMDPMCGSGTTLVEAKEAGFRSLGADLNPLSILISNTKCGLLDLDISVIESIYDGLNDNICSNSYSTVDFWDDSDIDFLLSWFDIQAFDEIKKILSLIYKYDGVIKNFLLVCLSDILRAVSFQKESDLRVRKEIKLYSHGEATSLFLKQVKEQAARIIAYKSVSESYIKSEFYVCPCNSIELPYSAKEYIGKVDLIITSPPYATALPYLDTDRLSLVTLGLLVRKQHRLYESNMIGTREISEKQRRELWEVYLERKKDLPDSITNIIDYIASFNHKDGVGFRRRNLPALLGKYFLSMLEAMKSAREMMKPKGKAFYIVGNNSTNLDGEKFEINTPELLFDLAEFAGWKKVSMSSMELISSRDMFRANRGTSEVILEIENS